MNGVQSIPSASGGEVTVVAQTVRPNQAALAKLVAGPKKSLPLFAGDDIALPSGQQAALGQERGPWP